ncbi:hypothetical protein QYM36_012359 [Artemia franciscana]|uniref:Uncharacterized protein n=1 Tax=Artemia franciscana TaxID=6661 RepID=A0AA88HIW7_ARTSF|nr:hypothetical protein QYM36_012359 [Artemia franciscana]
MHRNVITIYTLSYKYLCNLRGVATAEGLSDDSIDTFQKIRVLGEPLMDKELGRSELNIMEVPNVDNSPTDVKQYLNSGNLAEKDVYLDESLVALKKAGDHLNQKL